MKRCISSSECEIPFAVISQMLVEIEMEGLLFFIEVTTIAIIALLA